MLVATTSLLFLMNYVRNRPLILDKEISKVAMVRCLEMKEFSHVEYLNRFYFEGVMNKYVYTGENLGLDFATDLDFFRAMQNSKLHNDNILNKNFTRVGIAMCDRKHVILFAGKKKRL